MTERKELGKIQSVRVGMGGYQDAMWGAWFTLGGKGWGVSDGSRGTWASDPGKHAQWTKADQREIFADTMVFLRDTCAAAGVKSVDDLVGVPVEITFDGNAMKSWRVLTEVV